MRKGSITIFISWVLVAVLVVMTALLESARVYAIKFQITEAGTAAMDSLFSEFDTDLFEKYGLLFYNGSFGGGLIDEERMMKDAETYFEANTNPGLFGTSFISPKSTTATLGSFITATDYNGEIFQRSVLDFYKFDLAGKVLEDTKNKISSIFEGEGVLENGSASLDMLDNYDYSGNEKNVSISPGSRSYPEIRKDGILPAINFGLKEEHWILTDEEDDTALREQCEEAIDESPIGGYESVKDGGFLNLVIPSGKTLSGEKLDMNDLPSKISRDSRKLSEESFVADEAKKAVFIEYLLDYFNYFTKESNSSGAQYETEYVLYGQGSDTENLKKTVNRLLLIRTGMNMITIHKSSSKMAAAEALATAALGWTGMAPLILIAREGMILSWAYAESILDMRELLDGGKVPLLKDDSSWTLGAEGIINLFQGAVGESHKYASGLEYKDYLRMLLYMEDSATLSYRAMDLIQNQMRKKYPGFLMQSEIYGMEIQFETTWNPVFVGASILKKGKKGSFSRTDFFSELY